MDIEMIKEVVEVSAVKVMPQEFASANTDLDILKDEITLIKEDPLLLMEFEFLTIKTKSEQMKKLVLNSVQKIILALIKKFRRDGKPIRFLILKARQMG